MAASPTPDPIEQRLFNPKFKGDEPGYETVLFDQYKLYVEMMDKASERRTAANTFFVTLNSGILAVFGVIISTVKDPINMLVWLVLAVISFGGIVLCYLWQQIIHSYDQLNTGKFIIIHRLETRLPALIYDAEWLALEKGKSNKYTPLSHVERRVPWVFFACYIILGLLFAGVYFGFITIPAISPAP